jgi:hypothetical protein
MELKFMGDLYKEYGYVNKTPFELIEEFALEMLLRHQIQVTEINFEDGDVEKITSLITSKMRIQGSEPIGKISKMNTSTGRILLGTKKEVK